MWLLCARHCHRIYICIFIHRFVKIAVYIVLSFYLRMLILFLLILYLHSKLFLLPSQSRTSNLLAFLICIPFFFFLLLYSLTPLPWKLEYPFCLGCWRISSMQTGCTTHGFWLNPGHWHDAICEGYCDWTFRESGSYLLTGRRPYSRITFMGKVNRATML